jgi:hypothetical protein
MILPDGQIRPIYLFERLVQPLLKKYFCFSETQIRSIFSAILSHQEGRYAIVTFAGRAAVDAKGA